MERREFKSAWRVNKDRAGGERGGGQGKGKRAAGGGEESRERARARGSASARRRSRPLAEALSLGGHLAHNASRSTNRIRPDLPPFIFPLFSPPNRSRNPPSSLFGAFSCPIQLPAVLPDACKSASPSLAPARVRVRWALPSACAADSPSIPSPPCVARGLSLRFLFLASRLEPLQIAGRLSTDRSDRIYCTVDRSVIISS